MLKKDCPFSLRRHGLVLPDRQGKRRANNESQRFRISRDSRCSYSRGYVAASLLAERFSRVLGLFSALLIFLARITGRQRRTSTSCHCQKRAFQLSKSAAVSVRFVLRVLFSSSRFSARICKSTHTFRQPLHRARVCLEQLQHQTCLTRFRAILDSKTASRSRTRDCCSAMRWSTRPDFGRLFCSVSVHTCGGGGRPWRNAWCA